MLTWLCLMGMCSTVLNSSSSSGPMTIFCRPSVTVSAMPSQSVEDRSTNARAQKRNSRCTHCASQQYITNDTHELRSGLYYLRSRIRRNRPKKRRTRVMAKGGVDVLDTEARCPFIEPESTQRDARGTRAVPVARTKWPSAFERAFCSDECRARMRTDSPYT